MLEPLLVWSCLLSTIFHLVSDLVTYLFRETITMLGVTLDQNLTLNNHVSSLTHSIHFYTHVLRHIRPALMEHMAATLDVSLIQSRLDYVNSIMYRTSASNMLKLVCPQFPYSCGPAFSPPSFTQ